MSEPTRTVPGGRYIVISPDDKERRRTWPDPRDPAEVGWRATHNPDSVTRADLLWLVSVLDAYRQVFAISQREFLPTHAAIRGAVRTGER